MYKILEEKVMLRLDKKWYSTTAVLTNVSGGLQVNFVDADGKILKSQAYSRSTYCRKKGDGFDAEETKEKSEKANFSDPNFYSKMRKLGLENTNNVEVGNNGAKKQQ